MAVRRDTVTRPQNWDKAVSAAYLRLTSYSQKDAAKGAGVGERTLIRWEKSDWWPRALEEAANRWLQHLTAVSRRTLFAAIKAGDADKALKILERVDPRLAPPKQQIYHSGQIDTGVMRIPETPDDWSDHAKAHQDQVNRLAALASGDGRG